MTAGEALDRVPGGLMVLAFLIMGFGLGQSCGPPPEEQVGGGKEIQRIYTPIYVRESAQHVRDTIRLTQWRTRYDTVRIEFRITDTVWVKEYVRVSDSTIRACGDALGSCQRTRNALEELNRGLRMELEGTRRQVRAAKRRGTVQTLAGVGAGIAIGEVLDAVRKPP